MGRTKTSSPSNDCAGSSRGIGRRACINEIYPPPKIEGVAKKKKRTSGRSPFSVVSQALGGLWRILAKTLGSSIRFIARGARDLDPAHHRDGAALLVLLVALAAFAGTWFHADNLVSRNLYSFFVGAFGVIGFTSPLVLLYFAVRLFRKPEDSHATGRITIGTLLLILSSTALALSLIHI